LGINKVRQERVKEAISRMEAIFGIIQKCSTPMVARDHPELDDDSPLLNNDKHRKYQMIIGKLNWAVTIGRLQYAPDVGILTEHFIFSGKALYYISILIHKLTISISYWYIMSRI
jgi:hypothetical protein